MQRGVVGPCIEWAGRRAGAGYGVLGMSGSRPIYAHRVVYAQMCGPIPPGMFVMHRCDNPPCINPDHLTVGTPADNSRDAWLKGRLPGPPKMCGESNWNSKLTLKDVLEIRRLAAEEPRNARGAFTFGSRFIVRLAKRFGVSGPTIRAVIGGDCWTEAVLKSLPEVGE